MSPPSSTVLLTGATGFVGRNVHDALIEAGWRVRCATRTVAAAKERWPNREWVTLSVSDPNSVRAALTGCDAAIYLIHGMATHGEDFRQAEVRQARTFASEAEAAGLNRIVYLGGVAAPSEEASEHLLSREEVGEALRAGAVPTVELRASMIVGEGSLSWLIVRDLAARLPLMILPSWLTSRTEPVAIEDVVVALVRSTKMEISGSAWFDVPGPEVLSGREILQRTATALGVRAPLMIQVPFLSPGLSSHWVRFVTRADWSVAREIVVGLKTDLIARDNLFWDRIGHETQFTFDEAARKTLDVEAKGPRLLGFWGTVERVLVQLGRLSGPQRTQPATTSNQNTSADRRAIVYVLLWAIGAWLSTHFGIWLALGTTAAALGVAAARLEGTNVLGHGRHAGLWPIGILGGIVMAIGTTLLYEPVTSTFPMLKADVEVLYAAFRGPGFLTTIVLIPVVVTFEELVWRGAVQGALSRHMSWLPAAAACAVIYALAHAPTGSPALVLACIGAGFCWSVLRARTDSLPTVLAAHLVWDFAVLVFYQLTPMS
ncbi:MAG: CPBP family glutamic-type intramembrane protease [Longimicrobiales bacterium]